MNRQFTALDQGEKFQRFMQQMIRRKDDRRISGQHLAAVMSDLSHFLCMCRWCQIAAAAKVPCVDELCAATVPRQLAEFAFEWKQPPAWPRCNQRRLMATLCAIRDDDLSVDEQVLVAQAIQHVESRVPHAGLSHLMLSVVLVGAVQLPLKRPAFSTLADTLLRAEVARLCSQALSRGGHQAHSSPRHASKSPSQRDRHTAAHHSGGTARVRNRHKHAMHAQVLVRS